MVVRLWVPLTHWLWARNWNFAAAGACLTASREAKRAAVSTPLRIGSLVSAAVVSVGVILVDLLDVGYLMVVVLGCGQFMASVRLPSSAGSRSSGRRPPALGRG